MSDKGAYKYPAWCQMETALDSYQQDREAYLEAEADKLGPQANKQLKQCNQAADALVKGTQELVGVDAVDCLRDIVAELQDGVINQQQDALLNSPLKLVNEHVCITFGWEAMGMLSTARERFWQLLMLLKDRQPSPHARDFLRRVARCYLFGFDSECVVMCRAVLDRELKAEIQSGDVLAWWKTTDKGKRRKPAPMNLWGRIQTAHHSGRIGQDTRDAADQVRDDGNDAVHGKPSIADPFNCICKTVKVLDMLEQGKN